MALGTTSLIKKVERQLFAFWLECYPEDFPQILAATCSGTFDLGVESQMPQVMTSDASTLLPPFLTQTAADLEDDRPGIAASAEPEPPRPERLQDKFAFQNCVTIGGLLHALDGAEKHFHTNCPLWPSFKAQLQQVLKLFQPTHQRRFHASCLIGTNNAHLIPHLSIRIGKFSEHRWSSVVKALQKITSVETWLTTAWSQARFQATFSDSPASRYEEGVERKDGDEYKIDMHSLDASIRSNLFWATAEMLLSLQPIVEDFRAWLESCPCHRRLLQGLSNEQQHAWLRKELGLSRRQQSETELFHRQGCPMAGRNAPYLAAGEHKAYLHRLTDAAVQNLRARRLQSLSPTESARLMNSFAQASSALLLYLQIKTAAWETLPLKIAAIAHPDSQVARACTRVCIHDFDALSEEQRATQHALTVLSMWMVVERWLEQPHSILRRLGSYKGVGGAYCSLSVRFGVVMHEIVKSPQNLAQLCDAFALVRTPLRMATQLQVLSHPEIRSVLTAHCGRRRRPQSQLVRAVSNCIYMTDAESQYKRNEAAESEHHHLQNQLQKRLLQLQPPHKQDIADPFAAMTLSLLRLHLPKTGWEWFTLPASLVVESGIMTSIEDHLVAPVLEVALLRHFF